MWPTTRLTVATWDLLCRLTGRRDFLYVADCKLASTENMAHIHQHQGRFLTVLPRTRSEDRVFRDLLSSGQVQWRHIHDKRNDDGEIVDQYSVSEPATLSVEGYRLVWYHSTRKAEQDARARHQQVERALDELAELRLKLSSPRTRYRQERQGCGGGPGNPPGPRRRGLDRHGDQGANRGEVSPGRTGPTERPDPVRQERRALASSWSITSITWTWPRKRVVTGSSP